MADEPRPVSSLNFPGWMWAVLTVLVPIAVTAVTQMTGIFQKNRELDIKMIELGVGILRAGPQETGTKLAREWAIDVIEKYSGVSFSPQSRKELLSTALPVVVNVPQPSGADGSSGGWVAVGFLGSPNPSDQNFTLPNGDAITALPNGVTIKAKSSVNMRPSPANWNTVSSVLNSGQCFSVSETRALRAGTQDQVWARGDVTPCPPG